jgi:hypothetical protein
LSTFTLPATFFNELLNKARISGASTDDINIDCRR